MSTVSPAVTRAGRRVAAAGGSFLDAPVSGARSRWSREARLPGGRRRRGPRARAAVPASIGPSITYMGALGLAVTMKVAVNLGIGVQLAAYSESVLLAERPGFRASGRWKALMKSVLASPMLKYRARFVLESPTEALFDCAMMRRIWASRWRWATRWACRCPPPRSPRLLCAARATGLGDRDCAAIFDVLARMSGWPSAGAGRGRPAIRRAGRSA